MAVTRIFPSKSNTIYNNAPSYNAGIDQILELNSYKGDISRVLMGFDYATVQNLISGSTQWDANIKLYAANASGMQNPTKIEIFNTVSAWEEGLGMYLNNGTNDGLGAVWGYTFHSIENFNDDFSFGFLNGFTPTSWSGSIGGGDWDTSASSSIIIKKTDSIDINHTINPLIRPGHSGSMDLIFKLHFDHEADTLAQIKIKYFSEDTNTVYKPVLEIGTYDYVNTSVSASVTSDRQRVSLANNPTNLKLNTFNKINVAIHKLFSEKEYSTVYKKKQGLIVNDACYWELVDALTNEVVITKSEYTKISSENELNYFNFNTIGLYPNRYYRFNIFIEVGNYIQSYTPDYIFKLDG